MKSDDILFHGRQAIVFQAMPEKAAGGVKEIQMGHGGKTVRQPVKYKTRRQKTYIECLAVVSYEKTFLSGHFEKKVETRALFGKITGK
jgi:hypothetical protein